MRARWSEPDEATEAIPMRAQLPPGIYYVMVEGPHDAVPIRRDDYDANVKAGDDLFLVPGTGAIRVVRDGSVAAELAAA